MEVLEQLKAKYKLTSESETFLQSRLDSLSKMKDGPEMMKEKEDFSKMHASFNEKIAADFDGSIKEFHVPSAVVANGVPIDVIKPKDCARRPGIIVFLHNGAGTFGSRKTLEPTCLLIASELKCIVVNVEYRLAPEHKFPASFDDGKSVVRWVIMNKSLIGGENDSKVGVCGCGAGGGIALTLAFEVPGVDYQILVYPFVDMRCEDASFKEFEFSGTEYNMSGLIKQLVAAQINKEEDKQNVRASPILRKDFSSLPPTLLFIAEIDPFKESNYELKSKIKAANVECESKLLRGIVHGFFSLPGLFQETNRRVRDIIAQFYKKHGIC